MRIVDGFASFAHSCSIPHVRDLKDESGRYRPTRICLSGLHGKSLAEAINSNNSDLFYNGLPEQNFAERNTYFLEQSVLLEERPSLGEREKNSLAKPDIQKFEGKTMTLLVVEGVSVQNVRRLEESFLQLMMGHSSFTRL